MTTTNHILCFLLLCCSSILFISCNDDDGNEPFPACVTNPNDLGVMMFNDERLLIKTRFITTPTFEPDGASLTINGFFDDCVRLETVEIEFILENEAELPGIYTISSTSSTTPGTAYGSVLTQNVETLEQVRTNLNSGTLTITEDGGRILDLEAETAENDIISINTPI